MRDLLRALDEFKSHCEEQHPSVADPPHVRTHNVTIVVTHG